MNSFHVITPSVTSQYTVVNKGTSFDTMPETETSAIQRIASYLRGTVSSSSRKSNDNIASEWNELENNDKGNCQTSHVESASSREVRRSATSVQTLQSVVAAFEAEEKLNLQRSIGIACRLLFEPDENLSTFLQSPPPLHATAASLNLYPEQLQYNQDSVESYTESSALTPENHKPCINRDLSPSKIPQQVEKSRSGSIEISRPRIQETWTSQIFSKLFGVKLPFEPLTSQDVNSPIDTSDSVFSEQSFLFMNFETEDQWLTLKNRVHSISERLKKTGTSRNLPSMFDGIIGSSSTGTVSSSTDSKQPVASQPIIPETLQQWEAYNTEHSASTYIFICLLDGVALELQRRITERSNEIENIKVILNHHILSSLQFTALLQSDFDDSQPTSPSIATIPLLSESHDHQHQSGYPQPSSHPPRPIIGSSTTKSPISTVQSALTGAVNEQQSHGNTPYSCHSPTLTTTLSRSPGTPFTPAPVGANVRDQSPLKPGKRKVQKKDCGTDEDGSRSYDKEELSDSQLAIASRVSVSEVCANYPNEVLEVSRNQFLEEFKRSPNNLGEQESNKSKHVEALVQCMVLEASVLRHHSLLSEKEIIPTLQSLAFQYANAGRITLDVLSSESIKLKRELSKTSEHWKHLLTWMACAEGGAISTSTDPWLLEKYYIDGVYRCRKHQRRYLRSILQSIKKNVQLEEWRQNTLSDVLSHWVSICTERCETVIETLGSLRSFVSYKAYGMKKPTTVSSQNLAILLNPTESNAQGQLITTELSSSRPQSQLESLSPSTTKRLSRFPFPLVYHTDVHKKQSEYHNTTEEKSRHKGNNIPCESGESYHSVIQQTSPKAQLNMDRNPLSPRWQLQDGQIVLTSNERMTSNDVIEWGTLQKVETTSSQRIEKEDCFKYDSSSNEENKDTCEKNEPVTPKTILIETQEVPETPSAPLKCRNTKVMQLGCPCVIGPIPFTPTNREISSSIVAMSNETCTPSTSRVSPTTNVPKFEKHLSWSQHLATNDNLKDERIVNNYNQFEAQYTSNRETVEKESISPTRLEDLQMAISQLLIWLAELPSVKDNKTPYSICPSIQLPIIELSTALLGSPVRLSSSLTPLLQTQAKWLNGQDKVLDGILEGVSNDFQWQDVTVVLTQRHFIHVFDSAADAVLPIWTAPVESTEIIFRRALNSCSNYCFQLKDRGDFVTTVAQRFVFAVSKMALGRSKSCILRLADEAESSEWFAVLSSLTDVVINP